jgi:hypothetical protein
MELGENTESQNQQNRFCHGFNAKHTPTRDFEDM